MSKFTEFIASPNFLIVFILLIIVICVLVIRYLPFVEKKQTDSSGSLDPGYYDTPQDWSEITPSKIRVKKENGGNTGPLPNSDVCSLYVYQNNFDIDNRPNINTLFQDVYNDLAHFITTDKPVCLNSNEILAQHAEHTCVNKTKNSCINSFGNYVTEGTVEQFALNCGSDVPPCSGVIGNISFNFLFTPEYSIDRSTRFLSIDSLVTNTNVFNKLQEENSYYFQEGIFVPDESGSVKDNEYIPSFTNEPYKNNAIRQQFKFIRYSYTQASDSNLFSWVEDASGPYVSIIFIPANAYLSARIVNNDYQFIFYSLDNVEIEDTIQWFFMPPVDLNPQKIVMQSKITEGYVKQISSSGSFGTSSLDPSQTFIEGNTSIETGFGSTTSTTNYKINLNSNNLFAQYNPVTKGVIVKPFLNPDQNPTITITFGGDNNNDPAVSGSYSDNYSEYPPFVCQAITSGYAQDSADFYTFTQTQNSDVNTNPLEMALQVITTTTGDNQISTTYAEEVATFVTTLSFSQPINDTFNVGDVFRDNQVLWEVLDPFQDIAIFDVDYFMKGQGLSVATSINFKQRNNTDVVKYVKPKQGLVNKINFDKIQYSYQEIQPGSYQIILNETNTAQPSIPFGSYNSGDPAVIALIFSPAQDSQGRSISLLTEIDIVSPGSSYNNNQQFGLSVNQNTFPGSSSSNPITNLSLTTEEQFLKLEAVALDNNNNVFNPINDNLLDLRNSGLVIDEDNVTFNTGGTITLKDPYTIQPDKGDNGGLGYSVNDIIYFNELDQFNNSLLGEAYNPLTFTGDLKNLAQYQVASSAPPTLGTSYPANYNLLRSPGPSQGINLTPNVFIYNFWSNGQGEYSTSPPQVAFIGDGLRDELKNIIKTGSGEEVASYFASSKDPNSKVSNINNIKTIQFPELNYTGVNASQLNQARATNNALNSQTQPVLGRFIPYGYFVSPAFKKDDNKIPTGKSSTAFYNNNSAQIVPYGIKNIYKRIFNESDVPSI